jgi:hypothetical protein
LKSSAPEARRSVRNSRLPRLRCMPRLLLLPGLAVASLARCRHIGGRAALRGFWSPPRPIIADAPPLSLASRAPRIKYGHRSDGIEIRPHLDLAPLPVAFSRIRTQLGPAQDRSTGVGQYVASGGDRRRANQAEGAEFLPANVAHLPLAKVSPPRDCHDAVLLSWQRAGGNAQLKHIAFYIDAELDKACN